LLGHSVLLLIGSCSCQLTARSVTLTWYGNSAENAAGYELHHGPISAAPDENINVSNTTTATVEDLHRDTTCYFIVTADNNCVIRGEPSPPNVLCELCGNIAMLTLDALLKA
jgi:hypothetical protein